MDKIKRVTTTIIEMEQEVERLNNIIEILKTAKVNLETEIK